MTTGRGWGGADVMLRAGAVLHACWLPTLFGLRWAWVSVPLLVAVFWMQSRRRRAWATVQGGVVCGDCDGSGRNGLASVSVCARCLGRGWVRKPWRVVVP